MAADLAKIRDELAGARLDSPYSYELAVAVVNDCLRRAGVRPLAGSAWLELATKPAARTGTAAVPRDEQLGMLAYILSFTSLREETVAALGRLKPDDMAVRIERFFQEIAPLTAEMIRANVFRQEEFVRRWVACAGGRIRGESEAESERRLSQLDYRKTLAEYERAEAARRAEAAARAKALAEAAERESAARGWRE